MPRLKTLGCFSSSRKCLLLPLTCLGWKFLLLPSHMAHFLQSEGSLLNLFHSLPFTLTSFKIKKSKVKTNLDWRSYRNTDLSAVSLSLCVVRIHRGWPQGEGLHENLGSANLLCLLQGDCWVLMMPQEVRSHSLNLKDPIPQNNVQWLSCLRPCTRHRGTVGNTDIQPRGKDKPWPITAHVMIL